MTAKPNGFLTSIAIVFVAGALFATFPTPVMSHEYYTYTSGQGVGTKRVLVSEKWGWKQVRDPETGICTEKYTVISSEYADKTYTYTWSTASPVEHEHPWWERAGATASDVLEGTGKALKGAGKALKGAAEWLNPFD